MFEKMNILGPKTKEGTESWKNYTMRSFMICVLVYYYSHQMSEDEMGRYVARIRTKKGCVQYIVGETEGKALLGRHRGSPGV